MVSAGLSVVLIVFSARLVSSQNPFAEPTLPEVGDGTSGCPNTTTCESKVLTGCADGTYVTAVEVWYNAKMNLVGYLAGIRITFSNGSQSVAGCPDCSVPGVSNSGNWTGAKLALQDGELITQATVWAGKSAIYSKPGYPGGGAWPSSLRLITNKGASLAAFGDSTGTNPGSVAQFAPGNSAGREYAVGAGILCGITAHLDDTHHWTANGGTQTGNVIRSLGFVFLGAAQSATLLSVSYPSLATETVALQPLAVTPVEESNSTPLQQQYTSSLVYHDTTTKSWSVEKGSQLTDSLQINVKAGAPCCIEISGSLTSSLQLSASTTQTSTVMTGLDRTYDFPVNVAPFYYVSGTATIYSASLTLAFNAALEYTLASGFIFRYNVSGVYTGVLVSSVSVTLTGHNLSVPTQTLNALPIAPAVAAPGQACAVISPGESTGNACSVAVTPSTAASPRGT